MHAPDPVVFVLGASGYVGSSTVEELGRHPRVARVFAHVRPGSERADSLAERFGERAPDAVLDRTPLESSALAERLAAIAPTHIFLCHGTTARRARSEGLADPYETVDVGLTRLLVEAARALDPAPRMVLLSSMGTSATARGAYLAARWRAEEVIRGSGLPHTICRAPLLTGPDRDEVRTGERIARALGDPLLGILGAVGLGRLRDRYRSMGAREAAEGLVRSGFHYMTINRVVLADELRPVGVYEREKWVPESRRDRPRH